MILDNVFFEKAKMKDKIPCKCDYCDCVFERTKNNLIRSMQHTNIVSCDNKICVQKKRTITINKLFGVNNAFQSKIIQEKIVQKNMINFGCENPMQNEIVKKKQEKTVEEKYGKKNVFANKDIQIKIKEFWEKTEGVDNPFKLEKFQKKQRKTMENLYDAPFALQNKNLMKKAMDAAELSEGKNIYGKIQNEIKDWLNSFGFNFKTSRKIIIGSEIDLYDEKKNLAIEYCGLYWHNELSLEPRLKNYHYKKYKYCLEKGIQLITIFSDEWQYKELQCKSHIKSMLGVNEKRIYARNCEVKEIDKLQGRKFFDDYHIQGRNKLGFVFYGIHYQNELIGVISLGQHNRNKNSCVLDRLCFKDGVQITGGASKLFSRCVEWAKLNGYKEVISFSDNRWSLGKVYLALNFELDKEYGPDYSYVNVKKSEKRLSKQSQKKSSTNCPKELTESQWAKQRDLAKIWDCGKKRWKFTINS